MTENPIRIYQLDADRLNDIEDIKKILGGLQIRVNTDDPLYEEVKEFFPIEIVPEGYVELLDAVGHEEIAKMTYEEMEEKISELSLLDKEPDKEPDNISYS